jgi:hypothetical protein
MEALSPKLSCPSCKGTRLVAMVAGAKGLGAAFPKIVPCGKLMWVGYQPLYFACRDCGHLGLCLTEKERAELDAKTKDPQSA